MISSSVGVYYDDSQLTGEDDSTVDDSEGSGDEVPVGLIVGCTIGSVALVTIIIIVVYKLKKRRDEEVILPENSDVLKSKREEIVVQTLT